MDNGFAKFDSVIIPRRNMAMRFATVDHKGIYEKKTVSDAASKISYITMMQVRSMIVMGSSKSLRMGTTMAIRYSAVRRQGFKSNDNDSKEENQILDYKQQQHRLFPLLAASYCFFFTARKVSANLKAIEERLMNLNVPDNATGTGTGDTPTSTTRTITKTEVGDIHATTSALKSFCTTIAADGIEDCRKACGGHGFLQSSGFPEMINAYLQNPTVEGDNQMLPMQVVKILLKLVKDVESGKTKDWVNTDARYLLGAVEAMLNGEKGGSCPAESKDAMMDVNVIRDAYQHRAARLLVSVSRQIQNDVMEGKTFEDAWNGALIQMGRVSRAHSAYLLFDNFVTGIQEESESGKELIGPNEVSALMDLALLFGL